MIGEINKIRIIDLLLFFENKSIKYLLGLEVNKMKDWLNIIYIIIYV